MKTPQTIKADTKLLVSGFTPADLSLYKGQNTSVAWWCCAHNIRLAADIIMRAFQEDQPADGRKLTAESPEYALTSATMLYGFAMEVIIKAYRLFEKLNKQKPNGDIDWDGSMKTHDLIALLKDIKFDYEGDRDVTFLLRNLTSFARWGGRFPNPLRIDESFVEQRSIDNQKSRMVPPRVLLPEDLALYNKVFTWFAGRAHPHRARLQRNFQALLGTESAFDP